MTEIVFCLGVIVAMIGISVLTGLGLLLVFPARWLLRGRLESLLAWVFIGLGWWMLAFGWLTYMGLSTRQLRWPLLASGLIFSVAGLWKAARRTVRSTAIVEEAPDGMHRSRRNLRALAGRSPLSCSTLSVGQSFQRQHDLRLSCHLLTRSQLQRFLRA